ncbi:hypothetical protein FBUS_06087 [Fasciolopsis buskii]|uniref:Protein quiver n=1 Tax=Fasciolopsis buskii TaxID=27845 RepID=A0A8E0RNU9_9TREM|nr:hypothetical protein FBUS_06087 [Fasciolopsis buski]
MVTTKIWLSALFSLLLLSVSIIQQTRGIQCYDCNSFEEEACDSIASNAVRPITCAPGIESCLKVKQVAPFHPDPVLNKTSKARILRSCGKVPLSEFGEGCIERVGTQKVSMTYCICTGDMCNLARPQSQSRFGLVSSLVTTLLLFSYQL